MTILSPSFPLSLGHYRLVHRRPLTHSMGFIFFSVFFSFFSSISSFLSIALCSGPFSTAWSRRNNVLHKDKVFLHITLAHGYSAASAKRALLKWTLLLLYLALNPLHCTADSEHTITNTIEITVVRCVLARWCILQFARQRLQCGHLHYSGQRIEQMLPPPSASAAAFVIALGKTAVEAAEAPLSVQLKAKHLSTWIESSWCGGTSVHCRQWPVLLSLPNWSLLPDCFLSAAETCKDSRVLALSAWSAIHPAYHCPLITTLCSSVLMF